MIVSELEDLLALLPADMPVLVATGGGCHHVSVLSKKARHRSQPDLEDAWPGGAVRLPDGSHPPSLIIAGWGAPLWFQAWADEVPFEVEGRWPARPARRPAR